MSAAAKYRNALAVPPLVEYRKRRTGQKSVPPLARSSPSVTAENDYAGEPGSNPTRSPFASRDLVSRLTKDAVPGRRTSSIACEFPSHCLYLACCGPYIGLNLAAPASSTLRLNWNCLRQSYQSPRSSGEAVIAIICTQLWRNRR